MLWPANGIWRLSVRALYFFVAAFVAIATPAFAYEKQTVKAAQEALVRLGYDVGKPDGAWGPKSRAAMNELRRANGLPPADDFVGSSLWLVHRESPGETTLPNPGRLITDLAARREWLGNNKKVEFQCTAPVGIGVSPSMAPVPDKVYPIDMPQGFIEGKDDWYSEISEGLLAAQGQCVAGNSKVCGIIVGMAEKWAVADALKPAVGRDDRGAEDVYWVSNQLLRGITFAYGSAHAFETVEPTKHAMILDWLKRRIDQYHYVRKSPYPGQNHNMTHMMPAAVFGALVGDRSMMEPAFERWQIVLDSMRDDGSLPAETRRGARWFHYSSMQLGHLLTVRQLAASQGIVLEPDDPTKSIPKALDFLIAALGDFSIANKYAKENHAGGESKDYSIPFVRKFHFGFVPAYREQFGDDPTIMSMAGKPFDPEICSSKARKDDKVKSCPPKTDGLTFSSLLKYVGYEGDHNMGYPAGCFLLQSPHPYGDPG